MWLWRLALVLIIERRNLGRIADIGKNKEDITLAVVGEITHRTDRTCAHLSDRSNISDRIIARRREFERSNESSDIYLYIKGTLKSFYCSNFPYGIGSDYILKFWGNLREISFEFFNNKLYNQGQFLGKQKKN